jgi:hypothetical protein
MKVIMFKQANKTQKKQHGQSFIELAVILMLLIFMLAGVVEFGFMLNQYITLVEGTREVARVASKGDPFMTPGDGYVNPDFLDRIVILTEGGVVGSQQILGSIEPLTLEPAIGDDIVISIFSFANGTVTRYPNTTGWSKYNKQTSRFSNDDIAAKLVGGAPDTGAILIEVYYHYHQILNLMEGWTGPIALHSYSIMPLSAAEPTGGP